MDTRSWRASGELKPDTDTQALGDYFNALTHGLSVQARDGVRKKQLLVLSKLTLQALLDVVA